MSRGELVHQLAEASANGDRAALERTVNMLVEEARLEGRHSQARRLSELQKSRGPRITQARGLPDTLRDLVIERRATRTLDDLVLPKDVRDDVAELIDEQRNAAFLRANSVEPRHAVLLVGPPGNGKTSLAEAMASELGLPFLVVSYDGVVDSFLGETASRLRRILDHAAAAPCVLFFDEFDAIGKDRGDVHETGEIKRVVSSLLVHFESLPSHSVLVCATNHPDLIDSAAWRRFELWVEVRPPGDAEIAEMFGRLEALIGPTGLRSSEFVGHMAGKSLAEIEQFTLDVKRKLLLSKGKSSAKEAARAVLDRWSRRSVPEGGAVRRNGEIPDSALPPRGRRGKADPGKKARSIPEEARLPGTG